MTTMDPEYQRSFDELRDFVYATFGITEADLRGEDGKHYASLYAAYYRWQQAQSGRCTLESP